MSPGPILIAVLCIVGGAATAAGVYKRTGPDGQVEFVDRAVPESVRITREYLARRHIPPRDAAPPPREYVEAIAAACRDQRDRLETLRTARDVWLREPGGHRVPLSERSRALLIAHEELEAERLCRPGAAERLWREFLDRLPAETARGGQR